MLRIVQKNDAIVLTIAAPAHPCARGIPVVLTIQELHTEGRQLPDSFPERDHPLVDTIITKLAADAHLTRNTPLLQGRFFRLFVSFCS